MKYLIKSKRYKKKRTRKVKGGSNNEVENTRINNILFPLIGYKPISSPIILDIDEKLPGNKNHSVHNISNQFENIM